MKKTLQLLTCIAMMPLYMHAQPTIVQGDFPVPGTLWLEYFDNRLNAHTVTPGGPSQTWNYGSAFVISDTTLLNFQAPAAMPNGWASSFPAATCAVYSAADSVAQFFKSQANGFYTDGIASTSSLIPIPIIDVNPNQLLVPGNFTYNNTRSNTSAIVIEDLSGPPNILFKAYNLDTFTGDAYGSLVTPYGSYPNTLRIKQVTYTLDSTFIDILGTGSYVFFNTSGITDSTTSYMWLKNGSLALLMTIDIDMSNNQSTGASYYSLAPVGIDEPQTSANTVKVFPNPTSTGWVSFTIENEKANLLEIYSVDGKVVKSGNIQGINHYTISTNSLSNGLYMYQIKDANGFSVSSGKFMVGR